MKYQVYVIELSKKVFTLILISTLIRCIIASSSELGNVEAYYWTFAQHLQWNYFDHPPIVGWLIRLTTANLHLHSEFFTRAGAIISSAVSTILKESDSSRNRKFSVGTKPSRKMLMPA